MWTPVGIPRGGGRAGLRPGGERLVVRAGVAATVVVMATGVWGQVDARLTGWVGAEHHSMAEFVADGGNLVAGRSFDSNLPASYGFIWTPESGIRDVSPPAGRIDVIPKGVSRDGASATGYASFGPSSLTRAFVWTQERGTRDLGVLRGGESYGTAVSDDGRVVVGQAVPASGSAGAFRWSEDRGMEDLGVPGGEPLSAGADGSEVWITTVSAGPATILLRWTRAEGAILVGEVGSPADSIFIAAANGRGDVVGSIRVDGVLRAFRWNRAQGRVLLPSPPADFASATAVSADGATVLATYHDTARGWRSFRWTARGGSVDLADLAADAGASLGDWRMGELLGMSPDGRAFVGEASLQSVGLQGFVLTFPCDADVNADGLVDSLDSAWFVEAFEGGDPRADYNGDGFADFFDYDAFIADFETGC